MQTRRCTGACCREFPLNSGQQFFTHADVEVIRSAAVDGAAIADMIVPTRVREDGRAMWTCRHFDGRDCGIYERRPAMCADHGSTHVCSHPECELEPRFVPVEQLTKHQEAG